MLRSGPPSGGEHGGRAEGSSLSPVWSYIITNGICDPLHSVAILSPGPRSSPSKCRLLLFDKAQRFLSLLLLKLLVCGLGNHVAWPTGWSQPHSSLRVPPSDPYVYVRHARRESFSVRREADVPCRSSVGRGLVLPVLFVAEVIFPP